MPQGEDTNFLDSFKEIRHIPLHPYDPTPISREGATIYVNLYVAEGRAAEGNPINKKIAEIQPVVFAKALKAGVKIAFGNDVGGFAWTEHQAKQFTYMVKWGMTPMKAIQSATSVAAELLDMRGKLGEVSPGALADLVAVEGNPLEAIELLQHVKFVMKDAKVYRNEVTAGGR